MEMEKTMQIIHSPEALHSVCAEWRRQGLKTALVPTMGYYHAGHASLISYARSVADKVIVSLFVNPTQFGPNEDLEAYPRDFEKDSALVREAWCGDVLYAPEPENMYAPRSRHMGGSARVCQHLVRPQPPHPLPGRVHGGLEAVHAEPSPALPYSARRIGSSSPSSRKWFPI